MIWTCAFPWIDMWYHKCSQRWLCIVIIFIWHVLSKFDDWFTWERISCIDMLFKVDNMRYTIHVFWCSDMKCTYFFLIQFPRVIALIMRLCISCSPFNTTWDCITEHTLCFCPCCRAWWVFCIETYIFLVSSCSICGMSSFMEECVFCFASWSHFTWQCITCEVTTILCFFTINSRYRRRIVTESIIIFSLPEKQIKF